MKMEPNLTAVYIYMKWCTMGRGNKPGNGISSYAELWRVPRRREWSSRWTTEKGSRDSPGFEGRAGLLGKVELSSVLPCDTKIKIFC